MNSLNDSSGSQTGQGSFFLLLAALLKEFAASAVASPVPAVGHKGTDSGLSWFVLVVIIIETFAASGSRGVHDSFPVSPCAHLVDAAVSSLQPAVVGEVLVLFEYFVSDPLQHVVAGHPRRDGLQTDNVAAHLTLVQAADCCLLAIPRDSDEEGVPQGLPPEVPGHHGSCPVHHLLVVLLVEHHLDDVVALGPLCFLLHDPLHRGVWEEIEQAGLLMTLVSVLHVLAEQDVLSS